MYRHLYSEFLQRHSGKQHFASHSHHFWPDVTRQAMLDYWEDSASLTDRKWSKILGEKVPRTQELIARHLKFSRPADITFAPNTHDFLIRLMSSFSTNKPLEVLTTDSEFYSFERQMRRWEEVGKVRLTRVPSQPFEDFEQRFRAALSAKAWDLVFLSHVFFNSGVAVRNLETLVEAAPASSVFVLDAYHSYMALPVDLSKLGDRVYFLAGGYKYAQSGEGCCFMTLPQVKDRKPEITGWFAELGNLSNFQNEVGFADDGTRFAGSTLDYTALYRMLAVLELFEREGITVEKIHTHVRRQQRYFLEALPQLKSLGLSAEQILGRPDLEGHGHFLTFELGSAEKVSAISQALEKRGLLTDSRKSRLRFGFGLYHEGPYTL
ncbi:MAG: aminotransferase class V-fold PLP-dependent enzyme [Bdellovibrionales bacterium]